MKHFRRYQRHGDATYEPPAVVRSAVCTCDGCDRPHYARDICKFHYHRWLKHGDPSWVPERKHHEGSPTERARASRAKWREANRDVQKDHRQAYKTRRRGAFVEMVRVRVLVERDRGRCGICGKKVLPSQYSIDHILPLAHGGEHSYRNVRLTHLKCNTARRDRGAAQLRLPIPQEVGA